MKKKEKQEVLDIREDIPIRRYDKQKKCFQRENGSYSNLYQIIPRDLVNSDVDEIEMDCFKWAKFLKIYGLDIEIISIEDYLNAPEYDELVNSIKAARS